MRWAEGRTKKDDERSERMTHPRQAFGASSMNEPLQNILSLFESTVMRSPEDPAILEGDRSIDYAELSRKARRLAHELRLSGAGPDRPVGLCLERSSELVVCVLGILQSGAGYCPIDPAYPLDRIALMLEDADPSVVITDRQHQHLFKGT